MQSPLVDRLRSRFSKAQAEQLGSTDLEAKQERAVSSKSSKSSKQTVAKKTAGVAGGGCALTVNAQPELVKALEKARSKRLASLTALRESKQERAVASKQTDANEAGAAGGGAVPVNAQPEVAKALEKVGKAFAKSNLATPLQRMSMLHELDMDDLEDEIRMEVAEEIEAAAAVADGEAGDSPKYVAAVKLEQGRWQRFLDVFDLREAVPDVAMVEKYTAFLFKTRQIRSRFGREGLGGAVSFSIRFGVVSYYRPEIRYSNVFQCISVYFIQYLRVLRACREIRRNTRDTNEIHPATTVGR